MTNTLIEALFEKKQHWLPLTTWMVSINQIMTYNWENKNKFQSPTDYFMYQWTEHAGIIDQLHYVGMRPSNVVGSIMHLHIAKFHGHFVFWQLVT